VATAAAERIDLTLNGPQSRAFEALKPRQTICIPWGRGVGKSTFIRAVAYLLVGQWRGRLRLNPDGTPARDINGRQIRGIRIIVLMPTLKQFKDVHGMQYEQEITGEWAFLRGKLDKTTWRTTFPDGSWIQPFPAELANSKRSRGLRGDVVLTDETDDIERAVFEAVARPWFSEPFSLKIRLCGGTPTNGRHGLLYHLHRLGQSKDERDARYTSIHATYRDAPETVDAEEVEDARRNSPTATFKREWECDFDAAEGIVYGGVFSESFHVREPPANIRWTEILIGCDHGYEHPGVLLLIGVQGNGRDAVCWVLDEVHEQHRVEDWWKAKLRIWTEWYPHHRFYGDPSMPARLEAYRRDCAARVQETDNSVDDGVAAVADRFFVRTRTVDEKTERYSRLYVSAKCVNLIRELGLYKRKPDPRDPDKFTDEFLDGNDDGPDALRYAIFNRFGGPSKARNDASHESRE